MKSGDFYQDELWQGYYSANISAFYARKIDSFDMPIHEHPRVEIMYIASGQAHLSIANSMSSICDPSEHLSTYILRRNDLIFLNGGTRHRLYIDDDCKIYNVEFGFRKNDSKDQDSLQGLLHSSSDLRRFLNQRKSYVVIKDAAGRIENLFGFLMHELSPYKSEIAKISSGVNHDIIDSIMKIIILLVARGGLQKQSDPGELYVRRALEIIDHQFDTDIRISQISSALGISQAYLHRLCNQHMNTTLHTYTNRLRIDKAVKYLEGTHKSIAEIAYNCGFNNRQSFYKAFRKQMGCSARDYRNIYTKQNETLIGGHNMK